MRSFVRIMDWVSSWAARLAAILIWIIGAMLLNEVCARYLFLAPTSWAEELSRLLQVWATFLAIAYLLKSDSYIAIDVLTRRLSPAWLRVQRLLMLLIILAFCDVAIVWGLGIMLDSIRIGRAQASMLGSPLWIGELAIPFGFALLSLQCLAEILRLFLPSAPPTEDPDSQTDAEGEKTA